MRSVQAQTGRLVLCTSTQSVHKRASERADADKGRERFRIQNRFVAERLILHQKNPACSPPSTHHLSKEGEFVRESHSLARAVADTVTPIVAHSF